MARTGVRQPYFLKILSEENGEVKYASGISMGKAVKVEVKGKAVNAELDADDKTAIVINLTAGADISVETDTIPEDSLLEITGARKDDNGAIHYSSDDQAPYGGFAFKTKLDNGKFQCFMVLKTKFGVPPVSAQTSGGSSVTIQTNTVEGTAIPVGDKNEWLIFYIGDESDPVVENWGKEAYKETTTP